MTGGLTLGVVSLNLLAASPAQAQDAVCVNPADPAVVVGNTTGTGNQVACGAGATASASAAIAIGVNSAASGGGSLALGDTALATGVSATAIGRGAEASGLSSTAIGVNSEAAGDFAYALGDTAQATGEKSTAIGNTATAAGLNATAIGVNANATGISATAIGVNAQATGDFAYALGDSAEAAGNNSTAIGNSAEASQLNATAFGTNARALATSATAIGINAIALGRGANAFGDQAVASGGDSNAFGTQARATAIGSTAIGFQAEAGGSYAVAIGPVAKATGASSLALGIAATATNARDVALGANSVTDVAAGTSSTTINGVTYNFAGIAPTSTVSVGSVGSERTITNVAAGRISATSTDAINGSQLYATNQAIETLKSEISNVGLVFTGNDSSAGTVTRTNGQTLSIQGEATTAGTYSGGNIKTVTDPATGAINIQIADAPKFGNVTINDGGTGKVTGVTAGTINSTSTDAVNGSQLFTVGNSTAIALGGGSTFDPTTGTVIGSLTVGGNTYNNVQDALTAVNSTVAAGWNVTTKAVGSGTVTGTTVANVAPGSTATFTAGNNIAITQDGTEVQAALKDDIALNSVTANSLAINNGPTIDSNGIDMHGDRITNLGAGVNPMDAVNLSQLTGGLTNVLNQANSYTDTQIDAVRFDLSKVNRDARGGTAAAMAMSQVPQAFEPGMGIVGAGVSSWMGEQAIALGFSKASDNGRVIVKAAGSYNSRGQGGVAAGVGFQF